MSHSDAQIILKEKFKLPTFRPGQKEVIDSILAGRDTLAVMPTGSGKSLCYQIPALLLPGVTLVVSPLIALMKDQVDAMQRLGVAATFLNSTLNQKESEQRIQDVRQGKYKLLYVAPERFHVASFMKLIHQVSSSLLAVDEAHCISQWGHDFRPSYLRIKDIAQQIGRPPIVALTATATKHVQKDIVQQLRLESPRVFVRGFDRPNLKFFALELNQEQKERELIRIISSVPGSGIVYVSTKKTVAEVTEYLNENKLPAIGYHGGMEKKERSDAQHKWLSGEIPIIVATNAFGMGIDKPDVRFVLHYNIPGSMEAYYQEAGRAGRDGKTSYCMLFYNYRDRKIQEFLIENSFPPPETLKAIYEFLFSLERREILMTYEEIGQPLGCPELQVAAAIKLFEHYNILTRMNKHKATYSVNFLIPYKKAIAKVMRAPLQKKLLDWFNDHIEQDFELEPTLAALNINIDQFNNAMRQLMQKEIIFFTPPFRGRGIELTSNYVDWKKIPIDFKVYEAQKQSQMTRLAEIETYLMQKECRRKYILDYFGEKYPESNCRGCDVCLQWTSPELQDKADKGKKSKIPSDDMQILLKCVDAFDGVFGVTTIATILEGGHDSRFAGWGIDESDFFGAMKNKDTAVITRLIFAAIKKGYLERSAGQYPKLTITAEGLDFLLGKSEGKRK